MRRSTLALLGLIGPLLAGAAPGAAAGPAGPGVLPALHASAAGGGFFVDPLGRTVLLRGVNAVYKLPPYRFTVDPGQPNSLTDADAQQMVALGFDVVRLGIIWKGLEPGTAAAGGPQCGPGTGSTDPGQYDPAAVASYLAETARVVSMLAAHGIYTLIDMHQDVFNEAFAGEGAPDWATCTDGVPVTNTGTWNANYATPAVGTAFNHLWNNDVAANLQGEYQRVWTAVGAYFRGDTDVAGYDLFNEPFSTEVFSVGGAPAFDARLECFYTGSATPGKLNYSGAPDACSPLVPAQGVIPALRSADPTHMVFYEPDVSSDFGNPDHVGAMPFGDLVLGFHDYCFVGGLYGPFESNTPDCAPLEQQVFTNKTLERTGAASAQQPAGVGWFLSEFGAEDDATTAEADLLRVSQLADQNMIGWTYWQWRQYGDPTGSATEGMFDAQGNLKPKAALLSRAYPQALAGTPSRFSFDPASGAFDLAYQADPTVMADSVIALPVAEHYASGYCATASGAGVTSAPGSPTLTLANHPGAASVSLSVRAGSC
ncbi:MAG: cellulase family glycosylhydrolase [Candidatus Dormibacteria bacterium]